MGTDDNVNLPNFQFFKNCFFLFCGAKTIDIIYRDWKIHQSLRERSPMLQSQDGSRHQDSDLLAISDRFKCCTDGDLGFSKSYVSANKAVHGIFALHVGLDIVGTLVLVRRVFVNKTGFQFCLQHVIGRECVAFGSAAGGV